MLGLNSSFPYTPQNGYWSQGVLNTGKKAEFSQYLQSTLEYLSMKNIILGKYLFHSELNLKSLLQMFVISKLRQTCVYEKILFGLSLLAYLLILNEIKTFFLFCLAEGKKSNSSRCLWFSCFLSEKYRPAQKRKSNLSLLIVKKNQMSHILIFNTMDLPFKTCWCCCVNQM